MSITNQPEFTASRDHLAAHHAARLGRQGELTVDKIVFDTRAPKPQAEPPRPADKPGRHYSRAFRDGVHRALKEMRRGFTHAEIDAWAHGPLEDWVLTSGRFDPAPPIAERPNHAR